jgi:hypothetical protein
VLGHLVFRDHAHRQVHLDIDDGQRLDHDWSRSLCA